SFPAAGQHSTLFVSPSRAGRAVAARVFHVPGRTYVLRRPGREPLAIRPGLPEHRLGVIARLAGLGLRLEQIQVVVLTTAQPGGWTTRPTGPPEVTRGGTTKPSRRGRPQLMHHADN
uniref:hypothetical protein n=1 Tax=Nocardia brasiliensis TaxID=37326 RepID=UPI0024562E75